MLMMSGLLTQLQQHSLNPNGAFCVSMGMQLTHCDHSYKLLLKVAWNQSMSEVRVSVEWIFADIVNYFKFLDFKKNMKIGLSAVGKMYLSCALIQNAIHAYMVQRHQCTSMLIHPL